MGLFDTIKNALGMGPDEDYDYDEPENEQNQVQPQNQGGFPQNDNYHPRNDMGDNTGNKRINISGTITHTEKQIYFSLRSNLTLV